MPDPVLHGWGKGAQKGVRPHYCAQVAPSLMERQIPTRLVKTKQNDVRYNGGHIGHCESIQKAPNPSGMRLRACRTNRF